MTTTRLGAALLAALFILFIQTTAATAQRPEAGEVTKVQGAASVLRMGDAFQLTVGQPVHSGDVLETGADARLEIALADGTVLTLGADTSFELTGYVWMEEAGAGMAVLNLARGAFRAVTGAITDVDSPRFNVNTPLATIGIRGTDFWGGFLSEDVLDVLFVAGDKQVVISNTLGTTVLEKPGQGVTVPAPGAAPTPPKVWGDAKRQRAFDTVTFGL